jgi:acyl carrier protein
MNELEIGTMKASSITPTKELIAQELRNAIRYLKDQPDLEIPDDAPLLVAGMFNSVEEADAAGEPYQLDSLDLLELGLLCDEQFGFIMSGAIDFEFDDSMTLRDLVDTVFGYLTRDAA